jgi:hypothetical protein
MPTTCPHGNISRVTCNQCGDPTPEQIRAKRRGDSLAARRARKAAERADAPTPWEIQRNRIEATGDWPSSWGPFHRHFANDAIHRDGGPECDQPGTPRRVYVFDPDTLSEHERHVAQYAITHPDEFQE